MIESNQQVNPAQEKSGSQMPAPVDAIKLYSFRELLKGGKSFIFDRENRQIKATNLDALIKSLGNETQFIEPLKVVPADIALAQGRNLIDYDGNPVTGATAGVENMYVILDGQHRFAALKENAGIECMVEIVEPKDIKEYINIINNVRKSWDGTDRRYSFMAAHPDDTPLLKAIKDFSEIWVVSEKYAECAITGEVDKFKSELMKKNLADGSLFDAKKYALKLEDVDRANNMMKLLLTIFPGEKRVKRVELMKAVMRIRPQLSEGKKKDFAKLVLCFLQWFMSNPDRDLFEGIGSGDAYNMHVHQLWNQAFDTIPDEEVLYKAAEATIQAYSTPTTTKKAKKVLIGTAKEVLESRQKEAQSKGSAGKAKKTAESSASVTKGTGGVSKVQPGVTAEALAVVGTAAVEGAVEVSAMREFEANKEDGYKKTPGA